MAIYFITGNKGKFAEAEAFIPGIEMLDISLPEIQELDSKKIIEYKLQTAREYLHKQGLVGEIVVEDTALQCEGMNGLPGPFIKWFLDKLQPAGIYDLVAKTGNVKAKVTCVLGYSKSETENFFFNGEIDGEIVSPSVEQGFGWDPIFKPTGYQKTFAEISREEKNAISHRGQAFQNLSIGVLAINCSDFAWI